MSSSAIFNQRCTSSRFHPVYLSAKIRQMMHNMLFCIIRETFDSSRALVKTTGRTSAFLSALSAHRQSGRQAGGAKIKSALWVLKFLGKGNATALFRFKKGL